MKTKALHLVLLLQSCFLLGATALNEFRREHGTAVLLETVPVDPRDLLRGDYITLRYKISDLELQKLDQPLSAFKPGSSVYVLLEKEGEFYSARAASLSPVTASPGQVLIKGTCVANWDATRLHVLYGIERYYVAEGKGNPSGKVTVEAALSPKGTPRIRQVYVGGVPYSEGGLQSQRF